MCPSLALWACTFSVLSGVTLNLPELESFQAFLSLSSPYMTGNFGNKNWSCMELERSFVSKGQIVPMNSSRQRGNLRMTYKIPQTNRLSNPMNRDQKWTLRTKRDNLEDMKSFKWVVRWRKIRTGWRCTLVNGTFWHAFIFEDRKTIECLFLTGVLIAKTQWRV